jgi:hypothetical protein
MSRVTTIDAHVLKQLRPRVQQALRELGNELGLELVPTSGSYGGSTGQLKLEIRTLQADGTAVTREAEAFKRYAAAFGLEEGDLGRTFSGSNGDRYRIVGLRPAAPKRPVQAENVFTRRVFVFPVELVKSALRREQRP